MVQPRPTCGVCRKPLSPRNQCGVCNEHRHDPDHCRCLQCLTKHRAAPINLRPGVIIVHVRASPSYSSEAVPVIPISLADGVNQ